MPFTCWWKSIGNYWYSFQRSGTRNRAEHRLDSSRLFFFLHFLRIVDSGASTQNSVGKPKDSICESLRVPPEKVVERCGAHRDQATLKLLWRNLEGTLKIYWIVFTCGSLEVFRQKEYGAVSKTSMKAEQALFIIMSACAKPLRHPCTTTTGACARSILQWARPSLRERALLRFRLLLLPRCEAEFGLGFHMVQTRQLWDVFELARSLREHKP